MSGTDDLSPLRLLRAHPGRTAAVTVLLALAGAAEGVGLLTLLPLVESLGPAGTAPPLAGWVVRALELLGVRPTLAALLALILLALLVKALFRWLAMAQVGAVVAAVAAELRLRLLGALFAARWSHFTEQPAGAVAGALGRDVFWAAFAYRDACAVLAGAIALAIYAAVALLVSWRLGALALAVGVAASAPLGLWVRVSREAGARQTRHARALAAGVVDVLQAIKPIKAMGREGAFVSGLVGETRALRAAEARHVRATEGLRAMQEPLLAAMVLGILYLALSRGAADLGTVFVLAVLFHRTVGRFHQLQADYQAMAGASSAYLAVESLIHEAESRREPADGGAAPPPLARGIELQGVRLRHGARTVLDGVSLAVPAGAFVAIVGRSGAGKSSLLDVIAGLREPDAGEVRVDGVPLRRIDRAAWRGTIGYVPQESVLVQGSVLANVLLGEGADDAARAARALTAAGAGELVDALPAGLHSPVGERGLRLSGGERRRLALARALAGEPRLLLLDEATAELDAASAAAIGRTLRALRGRLTIVAVTHHEELAASADAVYVLAGGRLAPAPVGGASGHRVAGSR